MKVADFDYDLPDRYIAQTPLEKARRLAIVATRS